MNKSKTRINDTKKPYIINMIGDTDAEINMYGEVVRSHPTNYWTGEKAPGNFICLDEFLRDLDELSSKKNITVHINSVGGDFYAGLSIYNRLRALDASITTVNDSLAASAGSIIFMAGDKGKRKVNAASNLMVHGVLSFLNGYYSVAEIKAETKEMEAHNRALVAAYVESTGLDEDTVKAAISKDTYMTGQEAVNAGWADEVISDTDIELVNVMCNPDRSCLMIDGIAIAARCFNKLPENIPQISEDEWKKLAELRPDNDMQPAPRADIKSNLNGGKTMEITNAEELRNAFPDLVAQIEHAARTDGVTAERNRIRGIEDIQAAVGNTEMVFAAKYGANALTAEQLAFEAMKANAAVGKKMFGDMTADTEASGVAAVIPTPAETEVPEAINNDEIAAEILTKAIPADRKMEEK